MLLSTNAPLPVIVRDSFNGHPPLGVNATKILLEATGERYELRFQWAPTLGGECYYNTGGATCYNTKSAGFNGHPPLGVNATS